MVTEVEMPISMMPMHQGLESSSPNSTTAPGSATATSSKRTPSPTASAAGHASGGISKRPPRKSTLTQQQKNQKRQRATQDQLATLEVEFNKNPTPTANVRERIADEINMTERSVQIWFQNRYDLHARLDFPSRYISLYLPCFSLCLFAGPKRTDLLT